MNTTWTITFTNREGETNQTDFTWTDERPSANDVAIGIRKKLLGENFLLVDIERGDKESAVTLLKAYGYQITDIKRGGKDELTST